jgi:hypothetical protein
MSPATGASYRYHMVYIVKTVLDCNADRLAHEVLPVTFDRTADARRFMDRYIDQVYDGRGGYEAEHQSWWACDATATATLHRYTLVDEPLIAT